MEVDVTATVRIGRGNLVRFAIDLLIIDSCDQFETVIAWFRCLLLFLH
jgi:hypothetical protein